MAITFSGIANVAAQSAMNLGQAQASALGLGQTEANALGVTSLIQQDDQSSLVNTLLNSGQNSGNRLSGTAFKQDLMSIGQAALAIGPGRGAGLSASSSLGGSGSILSKVV